MILGVSTAGIGIALMIPRIWDGLIDPIVGRMPDNCHSRFGRRKPFIVVGTLVIGLLFGLIWNVPAGLEQHDEDGLLHHHAISFFTAYTIFAVPYNALAYEMSPDYYERTRVTAFFHKLGELASGWILPLAGGLSIALVIGATDLNMSGVRAMAGSSASSLWPVSA
jgi:GPH family glycoside/pentoside/hexuronide:cation symporter